MAERFAPELPAEPRAGGGRGLRRLVAGFLEFDQGQRSSDQALEAEDHRIGLLGPERLGAE